MTLIDEDFGSGGGGITPFGSSRKPWLAQVLEALAVPTAVTDVAVAADTVTLPNGGVVQAVQATTATTTGPKTIIVSGTPATTQVRVDYDANGIPTLTFAAADVVTVIDIHQSQPKASVGG
jgi:hypothetical protein